MSLDHGVINVPLAKRGGGSLDAQIDRHLDEQRRADIATERERTAARLAARKAEAERPKLTGADLADATHVRDRFGWHEVVRVSAKSVPVATAYSWTDRIPLGRVLEVRTIPPP